MPVLRRMWVEDRTRAAARAEVRTWARPRASVPVLVRSSGLALALPRVRKLLQAPAWERRREGSRMGGGVAAEVLARPQVRSREHV